MFGLFPSSWSASRGRAGQPSGRRSAPRCRPAVETLEDRTVPAGGLLALPFGASGQEGHALTSAQSDAFIQPNTRLAAAVANLGEELPAGTARTAYSQPLVAINAGTPPYSFLGVTAGSLPPGLTISGFGLLIGTPTQAGSFTFTATSVDLLGISRSREYSLTINPAPVQIAAVAFERNGVAKVRVKDKATGALRQILTPFGRFRGRLRLSYWDANEDGALDLVVQARISGKLKMRTYDAVTLARLA